MKKLLSILLATILLLTCLSAMAEERPSETALLKKFGLTLELSSLRDACANNFALDSATECVRATPTRPWAS